jgi:hypothetical protein
MAASRRSSAAAGLIVSFIGLCIVLIRVPPLAVLERGVPPHR